MEESNTLCECPICGGDRIIVVENPYGEPMQEQCEFCRATRKVTKDESDSYNNPTRQP